MLRLTRLAEPPHDPDALQRAPVLRLAFDERARSRLAALLDDGTAVAILLPRGTILRDGAVLASDSGELLRIEAATQPLLRITAAAPLQLLRAAYHLANRHVPVQLAADALLIEPDPVLEKMLAGLGARLEPVRAPFDPEPGAYEGHTPHHAHGEATDEASRTLGEQLSIEAHRRRAANQPR
jgi:urease accessory protein